MYVLRTHGAAVVLRPGESKLFRLPPISPGTIDLDAHVSPLRVHGHRFDVSNLETLALNELQPATPHRTIPSLGNVTLATAVPSTLARDTAPHPPDPTSSDPPTTDPNPPTDAATDLTFKLLYAGRVLATQRNKLLFIAEIQSDQYQLQVERDASGTEAKQYWFNATYVSQLPVLERRFPALAFTGTFDANWNTTMYVTAGLTDQWAWVNFRKDLADMYGLTQNGEYVRRWDLSPLSFKGIKPMSLKLGMGAGPSPFGAGGQLPYISATIDVQMEANAHVEIEDLVPLALDPFTLVVRLYLMGPAFLRYRPKVELIGLRDHSIPILGSTNAYLIKRLEEGIDAAQRPTDPHMMHPSVVGHYLTPWLVGGAYEFQELRYEPGPRDQIQPDGRVEPATGNIVASYVGELVVGSETDSAGRPDHVADGGGAATPRPPALFDVPEEDPDPSARPTRTDPGPLRQPDPTLKKIDHVVVLMMENRSFDHMLGYLSLPPHNRAVDGLRALPDDPNQNPQYNVFRGRNYFVKPAPATAWPPEIHFGPCHEHTCVVDQTQDHMGGFVREWATHLDKHQLLDEERPKLVMAYHDQRHLPVYHALATQFAVCDAYYCSHVGPTWPNRFVLNTGTLNRDRYGSPEIENPVLDTLVPLAGPTIFDRLTKMGATWKVFEHGYSFIRLYRDHTFETENVAPFLDPEGGFEATARAGRLPSYTLIEPDYIEAPPGNDDHAPADVAAGQQLVNRIVRALIASPQWSKTMLVITYDEHGGFYDHKEPPDAVPFTSASPMRYGPRVPTLVMSPYTAPGQVLSETYCHASIVATLMRRFAPQFVPSVSPRVDSANDFSAALALAEPRPAPTPEQLGLPPVGPSLTGTSERGRLDGPDDFHGLLTYARLFGGQLT